MPRAGDFAQGGGDEGRIVSGFREVGFNKAVHVFLGFQMFLNIPAARFDFSVHGSILFQLPRQFLRGLDVMWAGWICRRLPTANKSSVRSV
jgi:hypothetical protein